MKKFGFTLAEVLITLGIIGVVAAMTIPNLLTKMDHNAKIAKLQKSISIMNQACECLFMITVNMTVGILH